MKIRVLDIEFWYDSIQALREVSFDIGEGELLSIIGPNGAGKTTLLKVLARILKPKRGTVFIDGKSLWDLSPREAAKRIAYSSTYISEGFNTVVLDYLLTARYPHTNMLSISYGDRDLEIIERVLDRLEISHLAERRLDQLSSGELQRVLLARLLVQEPQILLIDEPTAHLDLRYQLESMELLREVTISEKLVTIITTHKLWIAAKYSDKTILLDRGRIMAAGSPEEVITPKNIANTYKVEIKVYKHPDVGLIVVPLKPVKREY